MKTLQMEPKHWAILGGFIIALGMQLQGVQHGWTDVVSPVFIGGVLVQAGTVIAALLVGSPMQPPK